LYILTTDILLLTNNRLVLSPERVPHKDKVKGKVKISLLQAVEDPKGARG
jgi:hypothetical protein